MRRDMLCIDAEASIRRVLSVDDARRKFSAADRTHDV
jgi:hypothetical protein